MAELRVKPNLCFWTLCRHALVVTMTVEILDKERLDKERLFCGPDGAVFGEFLNIRLERV